MRQLIAAVTHPVTVVTAPAGYGKTVVVDEWAESTADPVVKVELHDADTWREVAARIDAELPPDGTATLVLDGLDAVRDATLTTELARLVERAPHDLHVVLVARSRMHPIIRGLRGHADVAFVTAADLAFTGPEARALVKALAAVDITDAALERLMDHTEGWPVALELAAVGIRDAPDVDTFVDTFGGDDRHLAAFLFDDVFAKQSAPVQKFLASTSVLHRLTGSLCDFLTGDEDGAATLRRLELEGLHFRHVGGSRQWFTCHPLFREFLRRELRRGRYGAEADLLVRAGEWCASHDDPDAAFRYFIEAEAWQSVVDLSDAFGQRMFETGRADEAARWLDSLPPTTTLQANVGLRRAYLHTMLGESRRAAQILHDIKPSELSRGERVAADALRATWIFFDASPEPVIAAADRALISMGDIDPDELPNLYGVTASTSLVMMAATSRARAMWYLGEVGASRQGLAAGARHSDAYAPWYVHTRSALAVLEAWAGNLTTACKHGLAALAVAAEAGLPEHPATLDARIALAHVNRQRGRLRQAAELLDESAAIAERTRRPITHALLAVERGLLDLAAGRAEQGLDTLASYRAAGELTAPAIVEARLAAVKASLLLSIADTDAAETVLAGAPAVSLCPDLAAAAVHAAVARRDLDLADRRLEGWADDSAQPGHDVQRRLWTAVIALERGGRRRAVQLAAHAVATAEREGDIRVLLDGGRPLERLLRAVVHAGPHPHAERALRAGQPEAAPVQGAIALSRRELEVVRFLPTSLSSAEIAERLYISLNTLKTHLRTIYSKLGATNRREAIERAKELGLA